MARTITRTAIKQFFRFCKQFLNGGFYTNGIPGTTRKTVIQVDVDEVTILIVPNAITSNEFSKLNIQFLTRC